MRRRRSEAGITAMEGVSIVAANGRDMGTGSGG